MAVYDKSGNALATIYDKDGNALQYAYDASGNEIFSGSSEDYSEYDSDFQYAILTARDEWAAEYRADSTVLPVVLHTDQHGTLGSTYASELFDYLALAVNWDECSACINLGDVCDGDEESFQAMQTCLADIPAAKQIAVWGNHDTWGDAYGSDDWTGLQSYFDNSAYNGYQFMSGTKCSQYMIDEARGIKYVVAGGWDYDRSIGGYSHYVINSDNMDSIISMLSAVDNYDIVWLSHIQPCNGDLQYGHKVWYYPAVDGNTATSADAVIEPMVNRAETTINDLILGRKNKTSGTVYDSYGNAHSFDFTACTSDLICGFAGHWHADLYSWYDNDFPQLIFDAMHYDNEPFYFINVNRTQGKVNVWKIDDTATIYRYSVPFDQSDDDTEYTDAS